MTRVASLLNFISFATTSTQAYHTTRPPLLRISHKVMAETGKEVAAAAVCAPGGKCLPCESLDKSHLLSPEQIEAELTRMKLWSLKDGNKISRSFTARNFQVSSIFLLCSYFTCHVTTRRLLIRLSGVLILCKQCAMDSLVEIGKLAERENHHPDMHITGYRNVDIVLYTHSLGGISSNDIALAKMIDAEVKFDYSPLWLKNHPDASS
jgi:pterin-4a-carbinolamine dehydratase